MLLPEPAPLAQMSSAIVGGIPYSGQQITNANIIFNYWRARGLGTMLAIAGVANADRECSLNPKEVGDNGTAYNVAQWHWSPRGSNILAETGLDVRDGLLATGLKAMWYELNGGMRAVLGRVLACKSNEDASEALCEFYERAGAANAVSRARALATAWGNYFDGVG